MDDQAPEPIINPPDVVSAMLDDLAAGRPVPTFNARPIEPRRQPRSDAGIPRGPKNVGIPDGVADGPPRRGRAVKAIRIPPPKKEDISDIIQMAHAMAEVMISQKAGIKKEDADRIAEKMIPVMEDFGVVLVGKVVHVISLISAVVIIEAPIALAVVQDAQAQARAARAINVTSNVGGPPGAPGPSNEPTSISRITGVETGRPFNATG